MYHTTHLQYKRDKVLPYKALFLIREHLQISEIKLVKSQRDKYYVE